MMIHKGLLASAMALALGSGAAYAADSSTMRSTQSPSSFSQTTSSASQISLTQQQKKDLLLAASGMPLQNAAGSLTPGSKLPYSIRLSAIPSSARQKLDSALQGSEIAKLQNGDVIVANPTDNVVQAVITPEDANSTTGQGAASGLGGSSSRNSSSTMGK